MAISNAIAHRIPAGWYPDRFDRSRRRWWDGTEWTDFYSAMPTPHLSLVEDDPITASPDLGLLITAPTLVQPEALQVPVDTASTHTLVGALRFADRVPAFILFGLVVANVVVLLLLTKI